MFTEAAPHRGAAPAGAAAAGATARHGAAVAERPAAPRIDHACMSMDSFVPMR